MATTIASRCPHCSLPLNAADEAKFCLHCGGMLSSSSHGVPWPIRLRLLPPIVALAGSFLVWVHVTALPPSRSGWNLYRLGNASWGWLTLDIIACLVVLRALDGRQAVSSWIWAAWKLFGGLSLGMALSLFVSEAMGSRIAAIVNAPSPFSLGPGVVVFGIAALAWTAFSLFPDRR